MASIFRRFASSSSTGGLVQSIRRVLSEQQTDVPVQVHGWVKSVRVQKRVAFAMIQDGTSTESLQVVFQNPILAHRLTNGAGVRLTGKLCASPGSGQAVELVADTVDVLGECDPATYPIQKQSLTVEYLRDNAHLRTRTSASAAVLRLRDQSQKALSNYFSRHDFTYAHTPIITSLDSEGAGETFRIAPVKPLPSSLGHSSSAQSEEFFSQPAYLTVSSQLHLEALANSLSRVWTLSPCFRAEHSQTSRHLAEFWMLEAEWAFTDDLDDLCQVVEHLIKEVLRMDSPDRRLLWKEGNKQKQELLNTAASDKAWPRITYTEAIQELEKQNAATGQFKFNPQWGKSLSSEHERWLAEDLVRGPVFVTDYPVELKPFYMRLNDDQKTVACFDLLVPFLGELVGGSLREERLHLLEQALDRHSLSRDAYRWYLDLRQFGGVPHGGFGLGFERLISWLSGIENVRECIAMPRWAGRMLL
ncbi:hypothetical protein EVG20_g7577 [Dentipellis fragilis]|uniref:Asparagine--tRNA ligase, mitochondrial n=1 Tax=Dentipellis fragilis TaxID=205917 RepID=A0A4Y9YDP9_9AGAM|nr:hypothetical protein EVG20_g7577 [Dentipellis fragilis]